MSRRNANLELVLTGWIDARRRGDLETIERHLHPDVVWQGLRPDLVCTNRAAVLDNVRSSDGRLPDVSGIELHAAGDQVMLGVHSPDLIEIAGERLDGEIYDVFTIIDGLIVRMDEYRTRDGALEAMKARLAQTAAPAESLQRTPTAPVEELIPFVHVADVEHSIAFYELLGFAVSATHWVRRLAHAIWCGCGLADAEAPRHAKVAFEVAVLHWRALSDPPRVWTNRQ